MAPPEPEPPGLTLRLRCLEHGHLLTTRDDQPDRLGGTCMVCPADGCLVIVSVAVEPDHQKEPAR